MGNPKQLTLEQKIEEAKKKAERDTINSHIMEVMEPGIARAITYGWTLNDFIKREISTSNLLAERLLTMRCDDLYQMLTAIGHRLAPVNRRDDF